MNEINGKIAAILGNNEVVINRGKNDGVTVGMFFGIKLNVPEIVDPDDPTNILSGFFYTKGKIRIESVVERMAFGSIQPRRIISALTGVMVPWEKEEFPQLASKKLINDNDWLIRVGDEVYQMPVEKETKK